ncbi:MAG: type IV pilin protein [Pseudomonadota bacterium]
MGAPSLTLRRQHISTTAAGPSRPPQATAGFTLTEMLIVVAIITIIAAFALPNYGKQMERTRRTDAQDALLQIAAEQEKFYIDNNTYTATLSQLGFPDEVSSNGYYALAATVPDAGDSYTITATPVAGGAQANDTLCTSLSYDHTGRRTATDGSNDTTAECWR